MKERKRKGYEQREADKRIKRDQERREMSRKERKEASRKDKQKAKAKRARNKEFARVTYIFVALFLVLMAILPISRWQEAGTSSEALIMQDRILMLTG